jgi:hypothetical protein
MQFHKRRYVAMSCVLGVLVGPPLATGQTAYPHAEVCCMC